MLQLFFENGREWFEFAGLIMAFVFTCVAMSCMKGILPKDAGREFAFNGKLSEGKPRGAGILFELVFLIMAVIFGTLNFEIGAYLALITAEMLTGYLDDCSKTPWGEYKKGLLDLLIAVLVAVTYLNFNPNTLTMPIFNTVVVIPPVIYGFLIVVLVWASINVTNCADGVDGLSGTLSIVTLLTLYLIGTFVGRNDAFAYLIPLFVACLIAYLWYNATPSLLMMGDAGSRAMGIMIALAALKTGCALLYIPAAIVLILDGGAGIVKVSLLRFLKIKVLVNVRTPLHDHVRKVWGWSNTQTVFRFAIIQTVISVATLYVLQLVA